MNKINHYRITKYNPKYRDVNGSYMKNDWTSISDGVSFDEYLRVESRYTKSVLDCISLAGIRKLNMTSIEDKNTQFKISKFNREINCRDWGALDVLIRLILREKMWMKLEGNKSFYVHFGYDYYLYVGGKFELTENKINELYVESIMSPYLEKTNS